MKHGKKYRESLKKYDSNASYELLKACETVKEIKFSNFDETVEAHVNLKLGKSQTVRDTLVFPNQFKGEKKVLVFCKEDRIKEALDAGAAFAGADEYIDKVKGGWLDFDVAVATPDMMKDVGRLGMVLGRRGLMPNPKTGTVTPEIGKAIQEIKAGKIAYRVDKEGNICFSIARVSFDTEKVIDNLKVVCETILKIRPASVKGVYVKNCAITTVMGPSIKFTFDGR